MCGGTGYRAGYHQRGGGLSPRVRGNHIAADEHLKRTGSIPACAGEPRCRCSPGKPTRVYPRVCGGTVGLAVGGGNAPGLSPRVRGNQVQDVQIAARPWSIPACAGEPGGVCKRNRTQGLSPRVRGNRIPGLGLAPGRWSIPACAGEPRVADGRHPPQEVYPRVCGGTPAFALPPAPGSGLSPRVRGNRPRHPDGVAYLRSIPACAGEPDLTASWHPVDRVYPRVCGGTAPPPF